MKDYIFLIILRQAEVKSITSVYPLNCMLYVEVSSSILKCSWSAGIIPFRALNNNIAGKRGFCTLPMASSNSHDNNIEVRGNRSLISFWISNDGRAKDAAQLCYRCVSRDTRDPLLTVASPSAAVARTSCSCRCCSDSNVGYRFDLGSDSRGSPVPIVSLSPSHRTTLPRIRITRPKPGYNLERPR